MNNQFLLLAVSFIFVTSCSQIKVNNQVKEEPVVSQTETASVKEEINPLYELIDADNLCTDCVSGSSSSKEEDYGGKKRQIYFLYGAEELNLKNSYFDFPVVYNSSVKKWINYFTKKRGRELFEKYSVRASVYAPYASRILKEAGLPRDLIYLAMAESGYNNIAKSHARAMGPWQFMKFTGKKYGLKINWFVDERRDPLKAATSAAKYLKDLHNLFDSWELAMAGYNAGEGKVGRAIRRYRTKNFWKIAKRRYLRSETRNYVPKIMALMIIGKNMSSFGFGHVEMAKPWSFETIELEPRTDLLKLSKSLNIDFKEIQKLNPELLRWETPWDQKYTLRVPAKEHVDLYASFEDKSQFQSEDYMIYKVKNYATLKDVGRKFRVSQNLLAELNELPKWKKLAPQSTIKLPFNSNHSIRHRMYADLYERPRRYYSKRRKYRRIVRKGLKKGKKITKPSKYYVVRKGDSLWSVARKTGTQLNTLIKSNSHILSRRMIMPGDKLAIR
jgi:membrane-bound lytic murein transglycosylase D